VATVVGILGRSIFALTDVAMLFLFCIMLVGTRAGRGPSLAASVLAVAAYDFFFVPPLYTFAVTDIRHTLTFLVMFSVGVVTSGLTFRIRRGEQEARAREEQTAALYALSRDLGAAIGEGPASRAIATRAAEVFECGAAVVLPDRDGVPAIQASRGDVPFEAQEQAVARWVLEHSRPAGLGTDTLPGARVSCFPLRSGAAVLGVLALTARPTATVARLSNDPYFVDAFLRQASMGLERTKLAEEAKAAALRARTEEMRSSLLSAVSHDLRTPLAAITGAGTMLRDDSARLSAAHRADLLDTICEEAERLERLVSSLLDMTRLESGSLKVKREWVPIEELVVSATARFERKMGARTVTIDIPEDLRLVSVDPVLLEQVFVNLVENALKYTPEKSPLEIRATDRVEGVLIEVSDRGPGLPPGDEVRVFEKFYRGRETRVPGVGLGLAICRGIVEAHGGTLTAENRQGGGTTFRIALPIEGAPPALPAEVGPEPEPAAAATP
jgi:two-component system sensor histidine kinase KdpD